MIDEQAVIERLGQVLKRELGMDGLDVCDVEVQVYHRWDRHRAVIEIRAEVEPRC